MNFKNVQIPYRFNVSSLKNDQNLKSSLKIEISHSLVLFYCKLKLFFIHHVDYNPFICGKKLLKL